MCTCGACPSLPPAAAAASAWSRMRETVRGRDEGRAGGGTAGGMAGAQQPAAACCCCACLPTNVPPLTCLRAADLADAPPGLQLLRLPVLPAGHSAAPDPGEHPAPHYCLASACNKWLPNASLTSWHHPHRC